jgi:ABC-2 type transport system permease protein
VNRVLVVAKREYLDRVRTKAFLIGTILGPVLLAGISLVPMFAAQKKGRPISLAVLDQSGALAARVTDAVGKLRVDGEERFILKPAPEGPPAEREATLRGEVVAGRLDAYLLLPPEVLATSEASYYGKSVSNFRDIDALRRAVNDVIVTERLSRAGIDPARVEQLTKRAELKRIRVSDRGATEDRGTLLLFAIVMMMTIYMSVIMWGQNMLSSTIEEKTNRVVEVIVSALPATQLLAGKLLGVAGAGLTQLGVWGAAATAFSMFGMASSGFQLPTPPFQLLAFLLVYFLLGFLLYASLFAALGASVNTTQEAQSLVLPIMMPLIASSMVFIMILQNPDSPLSVVLSLIPFLTPVLMVVRMTVLTPPAWQIALSIVLMLLAIAGVLWAAARIYRVGILMYGKRPTFPELMRWVRHS